MCVGGGVQKQQKKNTLLNNPERGNRLDVVDERK